MTIDGRVIVPAPAAEVAPDSAEQRANLAALVARMRTEGHRATYRGSRRFDTPGEASAASQGYDDYPLWIGPDSTSYRIGWLDAEKHQQIDDDARAERIAEDREQDR